MKEAVHQLRDLVDDVGSVKESLAQLRELQDNVKTLKEQAKSMKEKLESIHGGVLDLLVPIRPWLRQRPQRRSKSLP